MEVVQLLKLIRLELKKHKISGYIMAAIIANIIMLVVACLLPIVERLENDAYFINYEMMFMMINLMARGTFIVFAGVLIAKFIIDEYKNKTMHLLFMYPIRRQKIILAKLIIISSFTFISIVVSNIIIGSAFYGINSIAHFFTAPLKWKFISEHAITVLFSALASAGLGLIPLYFGMIKKSVPTTIVSSILLVSIVGSSNGEFSLFNIIAIPATLAVVGLFIAYISIRNIEKEDIN